MIEYIKRSVPAYDNTTYPAVMRSIDKKLKHFMESVIVQEGEKIQFFKAHDIEGIPSSYGKIYYAERQNDVVRLMATIKKGQKAGKSFNLTVIIV